MDPPMEFLWNYTVATPWQCRASPGCSAHSDADWAYKVSEDAAWIGGEALRSGRRQESWAPTGHRDPLFAIPPARPLLAWRRMDPRQLINGLILYLGLLVLLTFHEFGHAWMALKCGDDTALSQGRVSLNPLVH